MKLRNNALSIALLFLLKTAAFGQLTIEKIDGSRTVTFPIGADISIKTPTESAKTDCKCFQTYRGKLISYDSDTITMVATKTQRFYFTDDSVATNVVTKLRFAKAETLTAVPNKSVMQITRYYKSRRKLDRSLIKGAVSNRMSGFKDSRRRRRRRRFIRTLIPPLNLN